MFLNVPVQNFESNFFAYLKLILSYLISEEMVSIGFKGASDFIVGFDKIQPSLSNFLLV